MTEAKWDYLRNQFLAIQYHCYEDENGNRPCDNGAICDACTTQEAQDSWHHFYTSKKES